MKPTQATLFHTGRTLGAHQRLFQLTYLLAEHDIRIVNVNTQENGPPAIEIDKPLPDHMGDDRIRQQHAERLIDSAMHFGCRIFWTATF